MKPRKAIPKRRAKPRRGQPTKAVEWTLIDEEHLPQVGDEIYLDKGEKYGGVSVEAVKEDWISGKFGPWTLEDYQVEHWTHYRAINPPQEPA